MHGFWKQCSARRGTACGADCGRSVSGVARCVERLRAFEACLLLLLLHHQQDPAFY